jgi:uncharacterized YigZ family protein
MAMFTYLTVAAEAKSDFRDRGSKFFGYAYPVETVEDCKSILQKLKKEHPKASHFCFAWRLGSDAALTRVSDDGEPSGSAGKPIEGQIISRGLTNTLVVVIRYFGGSLLGVPGLIHAYKTAAAEALDRAGITEKKIEYQFTIRFDYTVMNDVMMAIRESGCRIRSQDQGLFCSYDLAVPLESKEKLLTRLKEIRGVEISGIH